MHQDIHKPSIDKKTEARQTKTAKFSLHSYNQSKKKISYYKLFIYILYTPLTLKFSLFPTTFAYYKNKK